MRMIETLVGLEPAISRIRVTLLPRLRVVVALDTVVRMVMIFYILLAVHTLRLRLH